MIKQNYNLIIKKIKETCFKYNKDFNNIKIIAATKKRTIEEINELIDLGIKYIGESQIQEAIEKFDNLKYVKKHFIGNLQSNKVKTAVKYFDVIETIHSYKIANEINKHAFSLNKIQECYIEINIGKEESKQGIYPEEIFEFYNKLIKLTNIKITGIMCIPPYDENPEKYFKEMKTIFDKLNLKNLSMGMSEDFEIAIKEGANELRIGKAFFNSKVLNNIDNN
jgi:PLP dependent protein